LNKIKAEEEELKKQKIQIINDSKQNIDIKMAVNNLISQFKDSRKVLSLGTNEEKKRMIRKFV